LTSTSKNLPVPGVKASAIHAMILILSFVIIKTLPLVRRPIMYLSAAALGIFPLTILTWASLQADLFQDIAIIHCVAITSSIAICLADLSIKYLSPMTTAKLITLYAIMALTSLASLFVGITLSGSFVGAEKNLFLLAVVCSIVAQPWMPVFSAWCVVQARARLKGSPSINQKATLVHLISRLENQLLRKPTQIGKIEPVLETINRITTDIDQLSCEAIEALSSTVVGITSALDGGDRIDLECLIRDPYVLALHQESYKFDEELETLLARPLNEWQKQAIAVIHAYRAIIPANKRRACKFTPSCSTYCETAILKHGLLKGARYGMIRTCGCVPGAPSGWDPVP